MYAIKTSKLTKKYGELAAVNQVDLTIPQGELFGLLGPNGAGKTTLVHLLSTILPPTSGSAKVWGHDVTNGANAVRSSIGIVFQDPTLDDHLTGRENLDFHGRMYGIPKDLRRKRSDELLELVELSDRANNLVSTYSGGMRRRLEMARGLMHWPKILFLDEPTLGLDPQTRRSLWDYIQRLNKEENVTILLTTHYMEEADYLCNRVGIIDNGKIIALDKPSKLKSRLKGDIVTLEVDNPLKFAEMFRENRLVKKVELVDNSLRLSVTNGAKSAPKLMDFVRKQKGKVKAIEIRQPTLEDVFITHTGRKIREGDGDGSKEQMRLRMRARRRR